MKTKFTLLFLFLLFLKISFSQQWYRSTPNFYSRDVNSIAIINRNSVLIAGGNLQPQAQSIFRSDDFGLSWDFIFDNPTSWFKSIAFTDSLNGIAVGNNGVIAKSINGYAKWSYITPPLVSSFNKVFYANSQTLFIVGGNPISQSQVILKSTNGGGVWNVSFNQLGKPLKSVYFTNTQNGVAVGDSGVILKTTDGGNSWAPVNAPVQRDFNGITFLNGTTGFIVGGKESNDSIRTILKTTDGGNNWTITKDEPGAWLTDITFANPITGYAVGDLATLYKTIDGGQNWLIQNINQSTGDEHLTSIKFLDPDFGFIGANSGNAFVYTNTPQPEIDTLWGYYLDSTRFVVKALVNAHNTPVECHISFSTDNNFSPNYSSYNQYLRADTLADIGFFLQGLTPNTTYYYRLIVKSILGTQVYDTLSFYTYTPRYIIHTGTASNITLLSAMLNGSVNKCVPGSRPFFIASLSPNLTSGFTIPTVPSIITDTLLNAVTAYMSGPSAIATYYYTLALQTTSGIITGDTLSFVTSQPSYTFTTDTPSNITVNSGTVNGHVEKLPDATSLFFEYGTSASFGSTIVASPATVNDTLSHSVTASLTSLAPYTIYYYRLKGTSGTNTYYGNANSFFTNNGHFAIQALPATQLAMTSATLNGSADKFLTPVQLSFEYGPTYSLGYTAVSTPSSVTDSALHNASAVIGGLLPGTIYYYRLKGVTTSGTFYSNTLFLVTSNPYTFIQTDPATGITNNGAVLNGSVAGLKAQTAISFEYSTTAAFGSQGSSIYVTNISDTLTHNFSANITGLSPGQTYYYRIKGNAVGVDFYGNIRQLYSGNSEIPNWDFQYWQPETFQLLDAWNIAGDDYSQVAGHSGNYGLKLSGQTFTLLGIMEETKKNGGNGPGFFGGVPITGRPDSVSVFANVFFAPGDTGSMVIYLHQGNTPIAFNMFKLGGNSSGAFTKFTFPISYNSGLTPDSVVVAFAPINFDGNNIDPNDYMVVDDISFSPGQAQVYNGGFENWYEFPHNTLLNWTYNKHILVNQTTVNDPYLLNQTIFNSPADYAVELRNIYAYDTWWNSDISNQQNFFGQGTGGFPINSRHQSLNGFYKWFPVNGDTMKIDLELFAQGQIVGNAQFFKTDSVPQFTPLDIPINYFNPLAFPDAALITISSSLKPAKGPSHLIIDKLSFDGFTSVDDNVWVSSTEESGLKIYPNPTKDRVMIEIENNVREGDLVQLYSLNGQMINELRLSPNQNKVELNLADLNAGFYLLNVKAGNKISNGKIVVVK